MLMKPQNAHIFFNWPKSLDSMKIPIVNVSNGLIPVIIRIFLLIQQWSYTVADIDILYHKEVCDEEEFYQPYVRLLLTRQPYHEDTPILKLLGPGYVDVSKHTGILCINGPAIVYSDITQDPKCDSSKWIPSNGEPQLYSHDCFSINRLARDMYQQGEQREVKKDSQVYGNKVFGVYLLGTSPDYRTPNFVFLPRPDYGLPPANSRACIHEGASLAFMTNSSDYSSLCYSVKKFNMDGVLTVNYPGKPIFCFREDSDEEFDTPFHNKNTESEPLSSQDVIWTPNCAADEPSPSSPKFFEQEPIQLPDFRIIDPKLWSSQGSQAVIWKAKRRAQEDSVDMPLYSKPNPPGSMFHDDPGWSDAELSKAIGTLDETTAAPYQKFLLEIPAAECEEAPLPPESCAPDSSEPCTILNYVLTLDETNWKNDTIKDGSWRVPIFNIVNKIYEKICPQVSKLLPSSLSRVFQHLLSKELEADAALQPDFKAAQRSEWTHIMDDLNRCKGKAQMMNFFKKKDISALKLKKKLEGKLEMLQQRIAIRIAKGASATAADRKSSSSSSSDPFATFSSSLANDPEHAKDLHEVKKIKQHLNEVPLKFPYKILIGTPGNDGYAGATQVFRYREAAEVDHELDWALDAYWKVITTVLGYCHTHSSKREPATFSGTYDNFFKDFLKYISKAWVKSDNRAVYEQVFGDFIHGSGGLWIDACQNGAYQWSEIVELRPLRPLELTEGDIPPAHVVPVNPGGSTPGPANFFLDNPMQTKLNVDHYDYYEDSNKEQIPDQGSPELYTLDAKKT